MAKQEKNEIPVHAPRPKVTQLNKRVIVFIVAILACVFLLIIVNAYTSRSESSKPERQSGNIKIQKTSATASNQGVNNLPGGYGDATEIKALLSRGQPKKTDTISPEVKAELAALREQQQALLEQLQGLKSKKPSAPVLIPQSPLNKEAASSAIFFAGGAPLPQQHNKLTTTGSTAHKSTTSNHTASGGGKDSYASQNMQNQKLNFLTSKPSKAIYNKNTVQYPASKYIVQAGTSIPAILQTKIVSSLPGMIVAIVSQNVYDSIVGKYLIIPKGSKLIGQYNSKVSYGQSELQAKFVRLIRPDGTSIVLPAGSPGVNGNGVSGFSDTVNNHWGSIIGAAALMTVFNIPGIIATNQQNDRYVTSASGVTYPSMGASAATSSLQSVGQATSQLGSKIAGRTMNIQPTIIIHPGYQFSVMVTKDTILPPYHSNLQNIPG